jgi:hypothetical protein
MKNEELNEENPTDFQLIDLLGIKKSEDYFIPN